ncbi:MAG TPA: tetratricopeptide repeat protein [Solirubrobacterales bacterium]
MGEQRIRGNQNVQIQEVEDSWIKITYNKVPRVLPLESAQLSIASDRPSPARLTSARAGVFGYVGRGELLADLEAWIDSPAPFAGQVIAGRGGSGKTRLAVELCRRLREWDWLCGFLARGDGEGRLDALVEAPTARLVVIDYAENRAEQLERLLPQLRASASTEEKVRVLLLVRTGAGAEDIPRRLGARVESVERVIEGCEVRILEEAERLDSQECKQLFEDAVVAFGEYMESPPPPAEAPDFDQTVFESPLMVVIAAYLAAQGKEVPSNRDELLDMVLRHERRYWREGSAGLDADEDLLESMVALATLVNVDSQGRAAERLRLLSDLSDASAERCNRLARWVHAQYPGPRWWNPLEPDLVGERLVARCFTEQPEVLGGAIAGSEPEEATRLLEVLARAAADRPELAEALSPILSAELVRLCEVAVAEAAAVKDGDLLFGNAITAAAAINAAISVVEVDAEVLPVVVDLMPPRADLVLNELSATLTAQLVESRRLLADANPATHAPSLASALNSLSNRLANAGRYVEALEASEESVGLWRPLAEANPDAYIPNLAIALSNLSSCLADAGRHNEALEVIEESVEAYRPLANPATHAPSLARALGNLSVHLARAGRQAEALEAIEEWVETYRPLAEDNPAELARGLNNLSNHLADAGRQAEALETIKEAIRVWRPLAEDNPAAHAADLALALNNLSNRLADARRKAEALETIEESVDIYRALAEATPAAQAPMLASALYNLSLRLTEAGRKAEALETIEEAIRIWRPLAEDNPAAHAAKLALTLNNLADRLSEAGRDDKAENVRREATELFAAITPKTRQRRSWRSRVDAVLRR